ncbi:hypothetical protein DITRI_Ditri02bG0033600 [Diplodiscus trichospermus]
MDNILAQELYSESLQLSNLHLGHSSTANGFNETDIQAEDGSLWGDSDEELDRANELDREWQRRHDQFHTVLDNLDFLFILCKYLMVGCLGYDIKSVVEDFQIGYRDGLLAGKEDSAQQGFNIGFRQSVSVGYNWGLARGVTSTLASLPDELREKLIETQEKRDKFQKLYESVNAVSTTDALKLFHDDVLTRKAGEQSEPAQAGVSGGGSQEQSSNSDSLGSYTAELQSLLNESAEIKVQLFHQKVSTPPVC